MSNPIDFYFDFSSPYGYFAADSIDRMAAEAGRSCRWIPILLGAAFKASGNQLLIEQPLKGAYSRHDWDRVARMSGLAYGFPDPFPVATIAAARVFWWLDADDGTVAKDFARAVFAAYFGQGRNIGDKAVVAAVAGECGHDPAAALAAMDDGLWKTKCRDETEAAIAAGVFGSPFFVVDGEAFWGWDRLPMVRRWLETGGW
ncbi:2-hydroxychromene-2-carboxylate isomerase [Magnetospirillum sulfuroxidans]|uniref:2-hydroxychromene-2-carboxylate isomerase n=1 Tax=Magnetospirillum sulfuroxidans TaxID=611300 RepID=A0ABS5IDJ7_9PROT|nr:2-hydroxychromene-2-carboxylate isomerase [Magnetospirillum sulfuroxidans]MBR9972490.1 2-hydroxychromene-2-carboxylate isomerase [Magnetospirillum sulfuroxidans]